jgi:tRNA pseudouridine55 synthase
VSLPGAGIVVVDKATGWTSHDVVAAVRPLLGTRRVGHGGTLDPFATGVLPVLYGPATRLTQYLHGAPKSYVAEIVLGRETSTGDPTGTATEEAPVPELSDAAVADVLERFLGEHSQTPPSFSAVKLRGQRAYDKARRGEDVVLASRPIEIYEFRLVERADDCLHVLVTCSAGTYVRSLGRDVGRALGTRAHLGALRRIAVGPFSEADAVPVERLRALAAEGALAAVVHAADVAALGLPSLVVTTDTARLLRQGAVTPAPALEAGPLRVYASDGTFVGIAMSDDATLRPRTILAAVEGDATGVQGG